MGFNDDVYLSHTNISSDTTTIISTRSGRLGRVVVNGGTLTGTITIYDSATATGTVIATIGANQVVGDVFPYNCRFTNGLTVVTSAAVNITVSSDRGAG